MKKLHKIEYLIVYFNFGVKYVPDMTWWDLPTVSRSISTQPADLQSIPFLIRRQMAQDTCIPWCNEAFVFTYSHPYLYSIYIAVKSETYIKPSTTSEQTICRPINDSRSRPTALSFLQTQNSNVSESDKYIFTNNPGPFAFRHCFVYVCLWA